jgi:hypothetical protein
LIDWSCRLRMKGRRHDGYKRSQGNALGKLCFHERDDIAHAVLLSIMKFYTSEKNGMGAIYNRRGAAFTMARTRKKSPL